MLRSMQRFRLCWIQLKRTDRCRFRVNGSTGDSAGLSIFCMRQDSGGGVMATQKQRGSACRLPLLSPPSTRGWSLFPTHIRYPKDALTG